MPIIGKTLGNFKPILNATKNMTTQTHSLEV